jgi:hypothetical protein
MIRFTLTTVLLAMFVLAALFGLNIMFTDAMHGAEGCPFARGVALCSSMILDHLSMWHSIFAATLVSFLSILILTPLVSTWRDGAPLALRAPASTRAREPVRPPFVQELFSQGILNPKTF